MHPTNHASVEFPDLPAPIKLEISRDDKIQAIRERLPFADLTERFMSLIEGLSDEDWKVRLSDQDANAFAQKFLEPAVMKPLYLPDLYAVFVRGRQMTKAYPHPDRAKDDFLAQARELVAIHLFYNRANSSLFPNTYSCNHFMDRIFGDWRKKSRQATWNRLEKAGLVEVCRIKQLPVRE